MATPIPENRARFRLSEIAAFTGGHLVGEDVDVVGVVTDSRAVRGGELFVALVGERFDGHDHAPAAVEKGARAVLVSRELELGGASVVRVADTLSALGKIAKAHRDRWGGKVVGITGSAGKTGTKEMIAAALSGAGHRVLATRGNLNNRVGVPMTLLTLEDEDVAVIEMGTSEPGEIAELAHIARPDVGVITLIAAAHTEGLGDVAAVAHEKGALFRALDEDGVAVGSLDEPEVAALLEVTPARVHAFGRGEGGRLRIVSQTIGDRGTKVEVELDGEPYAVDVPLLGEPAVQQVAIALLVVEAVGGDLRGAIDALAHAPRTPGRLVPHASPSGALVIDDSYNANPRSMRAALEFAASIAAQRGGRAFAVLGEMKELGAASEDAHAEIVEIPGVEIFAVGEAFARALEARGRRHRVHATPEEAAKAVLAELRAGDVVVVKGSRSTTMERALPILLQEGTQG